MDCDSEKLLVGWTGRGLKRVQMLRQIRPKSYKYRGRRLDTTVNFDASARSTLYQSIGHGYDSSFLDFFMILGPHASHPVFLSECPGHKLPYSPEAFERILLLCFDGISSVAGSADPEPVCVRYERRNLPHLRHLLPRAARGVVGPISSRSCFEPATVGLISFEAESRLSRIEGNCFARCTAPSIVVPRAVEALGPSCFEHSNIGKLFFESESRLVEVGESCFAWREWKSLAVPRGLEVPSRSCFQIARIGRLSLESDSRVRRTPQSTQPNNPSTTNSALCRTHLTSLHDMYLHVHT
jgi:hypothetical protein